MHYQLPKITHPNFAIPRRKPLGSVEIDRGNSLFADTHYNALFINRSLREDINQNNLGASTAGTLRWRGDSFYLNSTDPHLVSDGNLTLSDTKKMTLFFDVQFDDTSGALMLLELSENLNNNNDTFSCYHDADNGRIYATCSIVPTGTYNGGYGTFTNDGRRHQIAITADRTVGTALTTQVWVDGYKLSMTQTNSDNAAGGSGFFANHEIYLGGRGASSLKMTGRLWSFRLVKDLYSDEQMQILGRNPYPFLSPTVPMSYFLGTGTSIPIFMHHYRNNIG